ncbi:MAG: hypothetical protein EOO05_09885 [Chitinophagaceae bacterium]|nr:MAG: hypothetical protein EOO05_09885 [Chitinophagaceae bacterium]
MKKSFVTFLLGIVVLSAAGQREILKSIESDFSNQLKPFVFTEKVYAHLDKPAYTAGETIWFKLYTIDGSSNTPSTVSKIVYAELLNSKNEPVLQGKVEVKEGSGPGSFYIPFTVETGTYRFRAYTSWMKNFDAALYYEQDLSVVNTLVSPDVSMLETKTDSSLEVGIFPEGGDLVNGLKSIVGFKVWDHTGKGVSYNSVILNSSNDTVARFSSGHFGMGQFAFQPAQGSTYRAIITAGTRTKTVELPAAVNSGLVMAVEPAGNLLKVTVNGSADQLNQHIYLLVSNGKRVKAAQYQLATANGASFLVDRETAGEGIIHLTLFNSLRQPVAERLYFSPTDKILRIVSDVTPGSTGIRSPVSVSFRSETAEAQPVNGDLSLSVYRDEPGQSTPASIAAWIWLGSELPGNIDSADYYFSNAADVMQASDNLMLVNGWRKFKMNEGPLPAKPLMTFLPEYEGHLIRGNVRIKSGLQPATGVQVFVAPVGKARSLGVGTSNTAGEFTTLVKGYYGPSSLVVQTDKNAASYQIELADPFSTSYSSRPYTAPYIKPAAASQILENGISTQVQNIYLNDLLQRSKEPVATDSTAFYGTPDSKFFLDKFTRFNTMEEVMREYVSAVNVRKITGKFHYRVNDQPRGQFFTVDPLVLLDGVPVFDVDKIATYDPLKVNKIEVMHRRYLLNNLSLAGIVSYSTYDGKMPAFTLDPSALVVDYEGLQLQREYYSPKYATAAAKENRMPDFRTQLLWTGNMKPSTGNTYNVSFYTSDLKGKFTGVVQGITKDGLAGSTTFSFEVK